MKAIQILLIALSFAVTAVSFTGCNKKAPEATVDAVEDAGDAMEDVGDEIEDATDEMAE